MVLKSQYRKSLRNMVLLNSILKKFKGLFNEEPFLVRSPGRVNLIGEHTDYNMGFVLPAAIDKAIYFAITPRSDESFKIFALDMGEDFEGLLNDLRPSDKQWPNYLTGVIDQLINAGYNIKGFNCVFGGDIPIGAGLSSSAALEAGFSYALNEIYNLNIGKLDLVKFSQKAENEFVGVQCGIMDQYINIFGKDENVLRIDCRSLDYEYFPFDFENLSVVLFDTCVSHSLATSEYNKRREECSEGVRIIKKDNSQINSLRDVTMDILIDYKTKLKPVIFNRCKYIIEENNRLLKACDSLNVHDLKEFGLLMYRSHEGLTKDYEVSCDKLDFLVSLTKDNPKIYGSRMMGGGFGGCTINLIENDEIESARSKIKSEYKKKFNIEAKTYITKISNGTSTITNNYSD
jgi:galactokinase